MDIGSIFLILALFLLTALYVARPLFERRSLAVSQEEQDLSALLAERDRILSALSELDFDHALGKIPEADYPVHRKQLLQRGAAILRQLDEYQKGAHADFRDRLELSQNDAVESAQADDPIEALIAARRRSRQDPSGGFCPQCGGAVARSDRFCPKCGEPLST